jgi:hypothetical protein
MDIDPHVKPQYLDNLDFYSFLRKEREANNEERDSDDENLRKQLSAAPWTAEEHPNIARWLEERSPVLDLFGVAVRKPNFDCYRWRPDGGGLFAILLPDVQSQRQFARELGVRITERLGKGDVDGAWYDVMSMLYLSRKHYNSGTFIVAVLAGVAIEGQGIEAATVVLQYGNPTSEQLERFASDLDSLQARVPGCEEFETLALYSVLHNVYERDEELLRGYFGGTECCGRGATTWDRILLKGISCFPTDQNIAGKRITEFLNAMHLTGKSVQNLDRTERKRIFKEQERIHAKKTRRVESIWSLLRVPLIYTRSQLIADHVAARCAAPRIYYDVFDRSNTRLDVLRVAVALERYKSAHEAYPTALDDLVPTYLAEVPLDVYAEGKPLTYKLAPDDETAFLVYSFGTNETDDGGDEREDVVLRIQKNENATE